MVKGMLEVRLIGAQGLTKTDLFSKIDPYVVLKCGDQQHTTKVVPGGGNKPLWNQKFTFTIDEAKHQHTLSLTLMDHDTFTHDDYLGQTIICLKEIIEVGVEQGKVEVGDQKYRVVSHDKTYRGEIHVGLTFILKKEESTQEFGGWKLSHF